MWPFQQCHRTRPARRQPARPRLGVEVLEDRTVPSGLEFVSTDPHDWPMFNHDQSGSRYNPTETRLAPDNVDELHELWRIPTDGALSGTPAVVNDVVYAADVTGAVYAVNRDGSLKWKTVLDIPALQAAKMSASPLVTNRTVIVGDFAGFIHGLDVETGQPRWRINPNPHPFAAIFGNGTMVGNYVAYGTSSFELFVPSIDPTYTEFNFRGSVVLLDPADGRIVWQTYTISDAEHAAGASGATVWGAPAYDPASNTIFVGTSNNYDLPTTQTSDALLALDATDGHIKWVSQKTGGDHWNYSFLPEDPTDPPDFDFGDSPQIYQLDGRTVVAAGQKSGFFHVVDAATGEEVAAPQQFVPGGHLGGFHIDSGFAEGVNYAPGNIWHDPFSGNPPDGGAVIAVSADGSEELWRFDTGAPVISGVAVANGVVYAQGIDGMFHALDAATGNELARLNTGGQVGGPAISRGQIYLGTGDALSPALFNPFAPSGPGAIIALGIADPVQVESVVVNDGSAQRSMVTSITVTFSDEVTLDDGAFRLRRQGGGLVDLNVAASLVDGKTVAVLTFAGPGIRGGSLADGNYRLTLRADRIHGATGRALDGDGDGDDGGNHHADLHRLFGDGDGDRDVDFRDLAHFLHALGSEEGDHDFVDHFDFDSDGEVDFRDTLAFLRRLGRELDA